jgi:hypothetical protein
MKCDYADSHAHQAHARDTWSSSRRPPQKRAYFLGALIFFFNCVAGLNYSRRKSFSYNLITLAFFTFLLLFPSSVGVGFGAWKNETLSFLARK